jgi:hypothetical protein
MVTNINKTNSHLSSQLIEATAYGIENPGHGLGEAQKCVGVKRLMESQILLLIIGFPLITGINV